jgi:hypothetical protein
MHGETVEQPNVFSSMSTSLTVGWLKAIALANVVRNTNEFINDYYY